MYLRKHFPLSIKSLNVIGDSFRKLLILCHGYHIKHVMDNIFSAGKNICGIFEMLLL